jgi:hypothetical protein
MDPSKLPGHDQNRESQLVLPDDQGQPGANNRPPDTATASNHGGTSPLTSRRPGHRDATASPAPATAATNTDDAAAGATA